METVIDALKAMGKSTYREIAARLDSRKHRKACARNWAAVTAAAAESWHEVIDCQDAADEAVAEDVSNWDA